MSSTSQALDLGLRARLWSVIALHYWLHNHLGVEVSLVEVAYFHGELRLAPARQRLLFDVPRP